MRTEINSASASVYIAGAGGHGREIRSYIHDLERAGWQGRFRGFLDDAEASGAQRGLAIAGAIDSLRDISSGDGQASFITAFGDNHLRLTIVNRIESLYGARLRPWTLIHPMASVGCRSGIGAGALLAPGAIITAGVKIGRHVILNVRASVSHDCVVGDFVNINPGATVCGRVSIGEGAYIGAGSVIRERITIGEWSVIGAGAVVIRDVPPHTTVAGVPARVIRPAGRESADCACTAELR